MKVNFNNYEFSMGDNILFRLKGLPFIKGKIYVDSNNRFYLCNNEQTLIGSPAPNLFGYSHSWAIVLKPDGTVNEPTDRDLCILPLIDGLEVFNLKINSKLIEFMYSDYRNLLDLFYLNIEPINKFAEIKSSDDGFVELIAMKNGAEVSTKIKLGRFIRSLVNNYNEVFNKKLNNIELTDVIVEKIHNEWKSFSSLISYKIVKGQDILDIAYSSTKYHKKGHLKSCMTDMGHHLHMYRDNTEQINAMVFYLDGFVCGRVILWKCTDDKWYHDRVYSSFDFARPSITAILRELGYGCLFQASAKHVVKLDKIIYERYPYLDSLKHIDKQNNILSNFL